VGLLAGLWSLLLVQRGLRRPQLRPLGLLRAGQPVILGLMFRAIRGFVHEIDDRSDSCDGTLALDRPGVHVSDRIVQRLLTAERRLGLLFPRA
jgi:hypothetical protein